MQFKYKIMYLGNEAESKMNILHSDETDVGWHLSCVLGFILSKI